MNPSSRSCVPTLVVALLALAPRVTLAESANTIGAEQCKACHEFEYQVWVKTAHCRAQDALTALQKQDSKCSTCHTVASVDASEERAEPKYVGIDCERCHGPGKYYHARYVMRDRELARAVGLVDIKPAQCMQCHSAGAPSMRPFDYEQLWARIDHGRSARQAWERAHPTEKPPAGEKPPAPAKSAAPSKKTK